MTRGGINKRIVLMFLGALLLWPAEVLLADELTEIKQQMSQLMERISQIEARQKLKEREMSQQIQQLSEKKAEPVILPDWVKNVKISGDLRYRHEQIDAERTGSVRWHDGQLRHRIRARLMLEAIVNDQWDVAFRLATDNGHVGTAWEGDPVSTNQDLEHAFSKKPVWLDLAFFNWHPVWAKGLNIYGGKMNNPFYKAGGNELIWDNDLTPDGIGFTYVKPMGDKDELRFAGGGFWIEEVHSTSSLSLEGADISLWGAQAYWKHTFGNPDYLLLGASFFDYSNLQRQGPMSDLWSSGSTKWFGNTTVSHEGATVYRYDYDLFELFAEYGFKCAGLPMAIYGDWVNNVVAPSGRDTGWLVGATLNKAKDPGSWELSYSYRELDSDAVVGQFSHSDFIGGGTDGRGHQIGLLYQNAKNVQTALTYQQSENDTSSSRHGLDYRRLQADLMLKFK